jgi:hypothetical protein
LLVSLGGGKYGGTEFNCSTSNPAERFSDYYQICPDRRIYAVSNRRRQAGQLINNMSSQSSGNFEKNPQGDNTKKNDQAEAALKRACKRRNVKWDKDLQEGFHDFISGEGYNTPKELLEQALQYLEQTLGSP